MHMCIQGQDQRLWEALLTDHVSIFVSCLQHMKPFCQLILSVKVSLTTCRFIMEFKLKVGALSAAAQMASRYQSVAMWTLFKYLLGIYRVSIGESLAAFVHTLTHRQKHTLQRTPLALSSPIQPFSSQPAQAKSCCCTGCALLQPVKEKMGFCCAAQKGFGDVTQKPQTGNTGEQKNTVRVTTHTHTGVQHVCRRVMRSQYSAGSRIRRICL